MSTADDAWQEWNSEDRLFYDATEFGEAAFMAGAKWALEDAADELDKDTSLSLSTDFNGNPFPAMMTAAGLRDRAVGVGTKDGDDEAPHVHQWRTFRPYNQPAYQSCAGCGNVIPAPKDDR